MVNTVKIGDDFEKKSYLAIKKAIENSALGISPWFAKVYEKKGYYSEIRKKDIIFDIAIEIRGKDSDTYNSLWLIECKNYKGKVPVKDINSFIYNMEQIPKAGKGMMITNKGFQSGVHSTAKSKGIMLCHIGKDLEDLEIILQKKEHLFDNNIEQRIKSTILNTLFLENIKGLKRYSSKDLEDLGKRFLKKCKNENYVIGQNLEEFIKIIKEAFGLTVEFVSELKSENGDQLKGACNIKSKTITINRKYSEQSIIFTLCHELGHFFLHSKVTINQELYDNYQDGKYNFINDSFVFKNPKNWIERQANKFASSIILPEKIFMKSFFIYRKDILGISSWNYIYRDSKYQQQQDRLDRDRTVNYLAKEFNVSISSIEYRMNELNLVKRPQKKKR